MKTFAKVLVTSGFALFAVGAQAEDLMYPGAFAKNTNITVVAPDRSVDLNRVPPNLYQYDLAKAQTNNKLAGRSVAEVRAEARVAAAKRSPADTYNFGG